MILEFDAELMQCLSPHHWKVVLELRDEMRDAWREQNRRSLTFYIIAFFFSRETAEELEGPTIAKIYVTLEEFLSQGIVEYRWRTDPPEVLERRGGRRRGEWRLTERGLRIRAEYQSRRLKSDPTWAPVPA